MEKNINDDSIEYVLDFPFLFTQKEKQKITKMIAKQEFSFIVIKYLEDTLAKRGYDELVEILKEQYSINSAFEELKNRLWDMNHLYGIDEVYDKLLSLIEDYRGTVIPESEADYLIISAKKYFDTLKGWDTFKAKIETTLIENIRKYVNIPEEIIAGLDKGGIYGLARLLNYSKNQLDTKCKSEWIELLKELENKGILLNAESIIGDIEQNFETISDWGSIYSNIVLFHLSSNEVIQLKDVPYKTFRGRFSQSIWCLSALKKITSTRKDYILIGELYGLVDSFMEFFPLSDDDKKSFDELKKQKVNPKALVMLAMKQLKNVQEEDTSEIQMENDFTGVQNYCAKIEKAIAVFRKLVESKRKEHIALSFQDIDQSYDKESDEYAFLANILNEYVKGNCTQKETIRRYELFKSFLNCKASLFTYPFLISSTEKEQIEALLSTKNTDGDIDVLIMQIIFECFKRIIFNPLYSQYGFTSDKEGINKVMRKLNDIKISFNEFLSRYEYSYLLPQDVTSLQETFESSIQDGELSKHFLQKFRHIISKRFKNIPKTSEFITTENLLMSGSVFALEDYIKYIDSHILSETKKDLITAANTFFRVTGKNTVIDSNAKITEENIIGLASRLKGFCENDGAYNEIQSSLETIDPSSPYVYSMQLLTDLFREVSKIIIDPDVEMWNSILDELLSAELITRDMWGKYSSQFVSYLYDKRTFATSIMPMLNELKKRFNCPCLNSINDSSSFDKKIATLIKELNKVLVANEQRMEQYYYLAELLMDERDIAAVGPDIRYFTAVDTINKIQGPVSIPPFMRVLIHSYSQSALESFNIDGKTEYLVYNYSEDKILDRLKGLMILMPELTSTIKSLEDSLEVPTNNDKRNIFVKAFIALERKIDKIFINADEISHRIYFNNKDLVHRHEKLGLEKYLDFAVNYIALRRCCKKTNTDLTCDAAKLVLDLIYAVDNIPDETLSSADIVAYYRKLMCLQTHSSLPEEPEVCDIDIINYYLRIRYNRANRSSERNLQLFIPAQNIFSRQVIIGLEERMQLLLSSDTTVNKERIHELINLFKDSLTYELHDTAFSIIACMFMFIKAQIKEEYIEDGDEFNRLTKRMEEIVYDRSNSYKLEQIQTTRA